MTDKLNETRNILRQAIFSSANAEFKRVPLNFKGADIEIKQPNLEQVNALWQIEGTAARSIYLLVTLAYLPGTDTKVFEEADADTIQAMPYGPEMTALNEIMSKFLVGDAKEAEKNSEATPDSTPSTQ